MALFFLRIAIILAVSIFLMWWFMPKKGDVALFEAVLKETAEEKEVSKLERALKRAERKQSAEEVLQDLREKLAKVKSKSKGNV